MANTVTPDGARIRSLRIRRGWTQEQLAGIAGVSTRSVQRTERGSAASLETLRALASGFSIQVSDLLPMEAAPAIPPRNPSQDRSSGTSEERSSVRNLVVESLPIRPGLECRDLPVRNIAFRPPSLPEAAVLTMSIVALVSAIAFVGQGWSSRYTAQSPAAEISTPTIVSLTATANAEQGDSMAAAHRTVPSVAIAVPSAPGVQALPATGTSRGSNGEAPPARAHNSVVVETLHAAAAWSEPMSNAVGTEGDVMLRAEERPSLDPTETLLPADQTATLNASPSFETSKPGALRTTLREAGRKTGGFFAKAGWSIGTSMKAVF